MATAPAAFLAGTLRPALSDLSTLLGMPLGGPAAEVQMLATALQETGLRTRLQYDGGPGRSFFQLEQGVDDLDQHRIGSQLLEKTLYGEFGTLVAAPPALIRAALADPHTDELACKIARLLFYIDPHALPDPEDAVGSYACYHRVWRPGKPRPESWRANHTIALRAVIGTATASRA